MLRRILRVPLMFMVRKPIIKTNFPIRNLKNNRTQITKFCTSSNLIFKNDIIKNKFYVTVDGYKAFVEYNMKGNVIELLHTYVPKQLEGRGIGGFLAKQTFEYVKKNNLKMDVHCDFLQSYLERHGEDYIQYIAK